MEPLSKSQVSGAFAVAATDPATIVCRIPPNAIGPSMLTATNRDGAALIYLKWVPWDGSGQQTVNIGDAPIELSPKMAYTWDSPPCGARLAAVSTVAGAILGVDGNWNVPTEADFL